MDQREKTRLLARAQSHVIQIRDRIGQKVKEITESAQQIRQKLSKLSPQDQLVHARVLQNQGKRELELGALYPSPYFIKCEIVFEGETDPRIFYFSKFSFSEEHVYSWTSPAAVIRFENPGNVSYVVPEFGSKGGTLLSKDQYMITNGKIRYMATESLGSPRQLVYQEYFSDRKEGFLLREIVEQMEKAQDKVIRAPVQGSFLITGPAGSGKTTLALHRVAYLLQSPDTAARFMDTESIVFVQDASTKMYFGKLLPQLGVANVRIVTFEEWAREQLSLQGVRFAFRYGETELERDQYEFAKNRVLKEAPIPSYYSDIFLLLETLYTEYLSFHVLPLFSRQRKDRILDRFDLTILLRSFAGTRKGFNTYETEYTQLRGGKVKRTKVSVPLVYSLMILDEVQNFLPEQVALLKMCIDSQNHSIMYVGDLAQQTRLCTIRDWKEVGERLAEDQVAVLQKNYRSTQQILEYIRRQGYTVEIPQGLKQGPEVEEIGVVGSDEVVNLINKVLGKDGTLTIGVLAITHEQINGIKKEYIDKHNVHVLTVHEAQGVEFDVVFLLSGRGNYVEPLAEPAFEAERSRVARDLTYVALTRAVRELYIIEQK